MESRPEGGVGGGFLRGWLMVFSAVNWGKSYDSMRKD